MSGTKNHMTYPVMNTCPNVLIRAWCAIICTKLIIFVICHRYQTRTTRLIITRNIVMKNTYSDFSCPIVCCDFPQTFWVKLVYFLFLSIP